MRTERFILFDTHFFLRTEIDTFSTHIGIRQNALSPLNSTLHLQCQKGTNEQVRIASVVTYWHYY
jgi:hypothetical protein